MANYSQDPSKNTLDPGPHFTKATQDPGDTIEYAPGETFIYTDSTAVESPDDPIFPAAA
jgi:hypothetical protein